MQTENDFSVERHFDYFVGRFQAMASPCDLFMDIDDVDLAHRLTKIAFAEARRVEQKFSRYRTDNIIATINNSAGNPIEVDDETARLIDYAATLYDLSDGLFDITSGVLRRIWRFDGSDRIPTQATVEQVLPFVGWQKVQWRNPIIAMPEGMEIDLGGIGKEYAVDRTALLLHQYSDASFLINYGGDLYATGLKRDKTGWKVGLDDPAFTGRRTIGTFEIKRGGVATSGDARRFLQRDGIRYGHILDPRTGWPVKGAPRGITVVAPTCTEAGMLATFAMLHGEMAEQFLREQNVKFWCY